jgi:[acyl-carrier-protein] S-malonyltransferase
MTLALLCSGQGRQHPGMFALTGNAPEAESLFTRAATLLGGRDPRELVLADDGDAVHENRVAQILCCLQAVAAVAVLKDVLPPGRVCTGYSVGEVPAWSAAGCMSALDTLNVVARRAEVMDAATMPGDGLVFVRGLPRKRIEDLCERHGVAIAIANPGDAFVVGGGRSGLASFMGAALELRAANVVRLPVHVASHTPSLASATPAFREILRKVRVTAPAGGVRLLTSVDGAPVMQIEAGLDKLSAQISHTVEWAACVQGCIEAGATAFLELGPGSALSRMAAAVARDVPARSVDDFRTVQGLRAWLAGRFAR